MPGHGDAILWADDEGMLPITRGIDSGAGVIDDELEDPEAALRDARTRFIAGFPQRIDAMRLLIARIGDSPPGPVTALRQLAHRMTGLAGMVGLPSVSRTAGALEDLASSSDFDPRRGAACLAQLADAFTADLAVPPPSWAQPIEERRSERILIVEDDSDQRALVASALRAAGFRVAQVADGAGAVTAARTLRPDLIMLDVDLPGLDGFSICRELKADPALRATPIVFLTSRRQPLEITAGLTLGADDYLTKPFEPAELQLRLRRLFDRGAAPPPTPQAPAMSAPAPTTPALALDYDTFVLASRDVLRSGMAALVLLRAPSPQDDVIAALAEELRRRDMVARYSDSHLLVLLPDATAGAAASRIETILLRLKAKGIAELFAGVTATSSASSELPQLLAEADMALAAARVSGTPVGVSGQQAGAGAAAPARRIVIAEDDPDVLQIIDPRLRAAGLQTTVAFDGEAALQAVARLNPDVLLLDLMMPKLTGFDVLARLRDLPPPRPRVIVISGRGREDDVMRAFDLGADDYLTKPFSPQELTARVTRLLR